MTKEHSPYIVFLEEPKKQKNEINGKKKDYALQSVLVILIFIALSKVFFKS